MRRGRTSGGGGGAAAAAAEALDAGRSAIGFRRKKANPPRRPFAPPVSLSAFVLALALSRREERGDTGAYACE